MIISHKHKFIFIKTRKTAGTSIEGYLLNYLGDEDVVAPMELTAGQDFKGFFNPTPEILFYIKNYSKHTLINDIKNMNSNNAPELHRDLYGLGRLRKVSRNSLTKRKFYNHMPAVSIKSRVSKHIWDNYFKFTVERNPWDKTISFYNMLRHQNNGNLTFDDYMQEGKYCLNYPLYTDLENIIVDRVIYYENLNKKLSEVFEYLRIPFDGKLPAKAKTNTRKDTRNYREFFRGEYEKYIDVIKEVFQKEIELHRYEF